MQAVLVLVIRQAVTAGMGAVMWNYIEVALLIQVGNKLYHYKVFYTDL